MSHDLVKTHASFDDPNLVSLAGLVPVMALAERCGLADLVRDHLRIASRTGWARARMALGSSSSKSSKRFPVSMM